MNKISKLKCIGVGMTIVMACITLAGCGNKDSSGKPLKASLNKSIVMMDEEYHASVNLKANKNAKYEVFDKNDKSIQGQRTLKTGKGTINFDNTGKYKVEVKGDNNHGKKDLLVNVKPYSKTINKTTSSVGPLQFQVKKVTYQKKTKPSKPNSDALFNLDNFKSLNHNYYEVVVEYEIRNNGDKPVDTSTTLWSPMDDNGTQFDSDGSADSYVYDTATGGKIAPHGHKAATMTMISNNKFSVKNLKFNVNEIWANDDEQIGDGGVAEFK